MVSVSGFRNRLRHDRVARFTVLGVCAAAAVAVILTLSIGFVNARDQLSNIEGRYDLVDAEKPAVSVTQKLTLFMQLHELILELEAAEQGWWIPWDRVFESLAQRDHYIEMYHSMFQQLLESLDKRFSALSFSRLESDKLAPLILGTVRRINLISAQLEPDLRKVDTASAIPGKYLRVFHPDMRIESAASFDKLYKNYLQLAPSTGELSNQRNRLKAGLETVMETFPGNMEWLIRFTERQGYPGVKAGDFWNGSRWLTEQPEVSPAYTRKGLAFIEKFFDEFNNAGKASETLTNVSSEFMAFYRQNYLKAWAAFAENFDDGKKKLRGRDEWLMAVESMATPDNPYFLVLLRIQHEIEAVFSEGIFTSRNEFDYFAKVQDFTGDASMPGSPKRKGKLGGIDQAQLEDQLEKAARAYLAYREGLKSLAISADSINLSYAQTSYAFSHPNDLASGDGAGSQSWAAIMDMQRILGKPNESTRIFWNLFTGPLRLAYQYMQQEAACYLQNSWEEEVIAELEDVPLSKAGISLIGEDGLLWRYLETTAGPFLVRSPRRGYHPNPVGNLGWTTEFIEFLNQAASGRSIVDSDFTVGINTLPTGVNQSSGVMPYLTQLQLDCNEGVHTLANYNYYTSRKFNWSLSSCGDVTLSIHIGKYSLRKLYSGQKGFAKFLADFRDGRRIFKIKEFPEFASQLRNENVHTIDVNYEFRGQQPVIRMLTAVPLKPPSQVAACWRG